MPSFNPQPPQVTFGAPSVPSDPVRDMLERQPYGDVTRVYTSHPGIGGAHLATKPSVHDPSFTASAPAYTHTDLRRGFRKSIRPARTGMDAVPAPVPASEALAPEPAQLIPRRTCKKLRIDIRGFKRKPWVPESPVDEGIPAPVPVRAKPYTLPLASKDGYMITGSIDYVSETVSSLTICHQGLGAVMFTVAIPYSKLVPIVCPLDQFVTFTKDEKGRAFLETNDNLPYVLRKPCTVTLALPSNGSSHAHMMKKITKGCAQMGVEFVSYDETAGTWTFTLDELH